MNAYSTHIVLTEAEGAQQEPYIIQVLCLKQQSKPQHIWLKLKF